MGFSKRFPLVLLGAALCFTGVSQAQSFPDRRFLAKVGRYILSWSPVTGSGIRFELSNRFSKGSRGLDTGPHIARPGDFACDPSLSDFILVGESRSGEGTVLVVRLDITGALVVTGSLVVSHHGLVGVAYSGATSRLYLLDCQGVVYCAPFQVGGNLPSLSAWEVIAGPDDCRELLHVSGNTLYIRSDEDGVEPMVSIIMHSFGSKRDGLRVARRRYFRHGKAGVTFHHKWMPKPVQIEERLLQVGQSTIQVSGKPGCGAILMDVDTSPMQSLGSCTIGPAGTGLIRLAEPINSLGGLIGLESGESALVESRIMTPHPVYCHAGRPGSLPGSLMGTHLLPLRSTGVNAYIGNRCFGVPLDVEVSPAQQWPVRYPVQLLVAGLTDPANPPIDQGRGLLIPHCYFIGTLAIDHQRRSAGAWQSLPLPEDPALVGGVLLHQWIVQTGPSEHSYTEIVGTVIRAGAKQFQSASAAAAKPTDSDPEQRINRFIRGNCRSTQAALTALSKTKGANVLTRRTLPAFMARIRK